MRVKSLSWVEDSFCVAGHEETKCRVVPVAPNVSSTPQRLGVWFSSAASTRLPAHAHDGAELNLVMAGEATYRTPAGVRTLRAGELFVLPRGVVHEMIAASAEMAMWVVEFGAGVREQWSLEWTEQLAVLTPSSGYRAEMVTHLKKLWLRPSEPKAQLLEHSLYRLLEKLELGTEPLVSKPNSTVARARRLCDAERGDLSTQSLARRSGVSPSRLAHLFQSELGVTPLQYRNFIRLQHFIQSHDRRAPNLLRRALTSGFGSYAQFHRVFHQVCGTPPGTHLRWLESDAGIDPARTMGEV